MEASRRVPIIRSARPERYALAFAAVGAAFLVRWLLSSVLPRESIPFVTFFFAVMAAAWYGGLGPGLVAALASAIAANYYFIPPVGTLTLNPSYVIGAVLFIAEAVGIAFLSGQLHKAEQEAVAAASKREQLLGSISDAFVALDADWRYAVVNQRAAQMLGKPAAELLGRRLWDLFPDTVGTAFWTELQEAKRSQRPRSFEFFYEPWRRWFEIRLYPMQDEGLSVFFTDVTEHKQADAALRASEERLRLAMEAGRVGVWDWDVGADRMSWTDSVYRIHGVKPEDVAPTAEGFASLLHPDDREAVRGAIESALRGDAPFQVEFRSVRPDGSVAWLHSQAVVLREQGRPVRMIGATVDVTSRKQAEEDLRRWSAELEQRVSERTSELTQSHEHLRALASELALTEQRERQRLATDLHDYLAQLLVLIRLKLGQVKKLDVPAKVLEYVNQSDDVLQQALTYTRTLIADLSPPVLRDAGLGPALQWLARDMERFGLSVRAEIIDGSTEDIATDKAVLLFQSVRELLMNVVKHAKAGGALVRLVRTERELCITVRDDGCGFEVPRVPGSQAAGFGLFSIQERLLALGGSFELRSSPGQGTSVELILPCAASFAGSVP